MFFKKCFLILPSHQVICANGTFLTSSYEEGGECERLTFAKFVKTDAESDADGSVSPWSAPGGTSGVAVSGKTIPLPTPPGEDEANQPR